MNIKLSRDELLVKFNEQIDLLRLAVDNYDG